MLAGRTEMLQSLKLFQCPFCNHGFTSRDASRLHNVSRFPLILKCGHTVCESCAKHASKFNQRIVCAVCQNPTDLEEGEISVSKLLPDVYVLGVLSANLKQSLPSLKTKLVAAGSSLNTSNRKQRNKGIPLVLCEQCSVNQASWKCDKCEENYCNICFDHIHKSGNLKVMKKHVGTPIYVESYMSLVQQGCIEHSNRPIEFYCEEDQKLACSYCVIMGNHKGHPVLTLLEKNKSCADDLKKIHEELLVMRRRFKFTENKLALVIPSEKIDNSHITKEIHNHFHKLHAILTLRENELLTEVETISNSNVSPLEKLRQEVSDYSKDLDAILQDTTQVLQNPCLSVSSPAIIEKLEACKSLPCHLVPLKLEDWAERGIDATFKSELEETLMQHGEIEAHVKPKYTLKANDDLPEDFIVEPLPEESCITDNESVTSRSDTFSEDSLTSPVNTKMSLPLKYNQFTAIKQEKIIVSHIRHPTCFWVQRSAENRKLKIMSEKINRWCRTTEASRHVPHSVKRGDLYLVRYNTDNKWYRARVKEIFPMSENKSNDSSDEDIDLPFNPEASRDQKCSPKIQEQRVEVSYVDFGNTEIVPFSRLRDIQTQFLNLPGLAKECCLWNIYPTGGTSWSSEAIKLFAKFVGNKEVVMQVMEERNNIIYVDLCESASSDIINDVPVSVRDALVFLEYGCFLPGVKLTSKRNRSLRHFMPPEQLRANAKTSAIISHIESPSFFYVQQISTSRYLSELILDMQKSYADECGFIQTIYVPYIGMICAAQFSVDKHWYRAEVIGLPGGAMVEVQYVDFGNKEVVHHKNLRKIFDRFTRLNKQAALCSLADITYNQEKEWPQEAKDWLVKYAAKKIFMLLSIGIVPGENVTKVVLYDVQEDEEICINTLMVVEGIASSCGPNSTVLKKAREQPAAKLVMATPPPPVIIPTECPLEIGAQCMVPPPKSVKPNKEVGDALVEVHISHIESPSLFYIRLANQIEQKLERLMTELQGVYSDFECDVTEFSPGEVFATLYEKEKKWYRAAITSTVSDNTVEMRFVDYGFVDTVPLKNLRVLMERFCEDESFSIKCHLAGINPAGDSSKWSQIACEAFKELVCPHEILHLTCKGEIIEKSLPVDLLIEQLIRGGALEPTTLNYISVSAQLVEKGVALKTRKIKDKSSKPTESSEKNDNIIKILSPKPSESSPVSSSTTSRTSSPASVKKAVISRTPPKPSFQWKPYDLPEEVEFIGMPSYVSDDACIYIHLIHQGSKVDMIKKALQCRYASGKDEKLRIPPPVGEACIAKFFLDSMWYRAEVVSSTPDHVKVQFVDYGNCEIVPLENICTDIILKDYPRQSVECVLHGIKPRGRKKWPTNVLDFLHDTIVEQNCLIEVQVPPEPGKRLEISLVIQQTKVDVIDLMKDIGSAIPVDEIDDSVDDSLDDIKPSTSFEDSSIKLDDLLGPRFRKATSPKQGVPVPVCLTQLLQPNLVYLQQMKIKDPISDDDLERNAEFNKFLLLIEELAQKAESFPVVIKPQLGMACCAKYSFDNSWYRCQVTGIEETGINVRYVDYGNSEIIPAESLRMPDEHFLDFPVQALLCKISGLEPVQNDWSPEATSAMVGKLFHGNDEVYARILSPGEICEVELLLKTTGGELELLYKDLITKGIVKFNGS